MNRLALGLLAVGALAASSNAAIITFEGQSNTIYTAPITRSGFDIGNVAGDEQHFHEITSTDFSLPNNGTGVLLNDRDTRIFVVMNGGGTFAFNSVDVAESTGNSPGTGLIISGFLSNVLVGTINLGIDGTYDSISGASLGTVDRLEFDGTGGGGGFVLDNLDVGEASGVPEPSTMLLAGLGLLSVVIARRKRA